MNELSQNRTKRWFNRIKKSRRLYFYERIRESGFLFREFPKWLWKDVVYSAKWGLNIFLQIRAFGVDIRRNYKCSFWNQFFRMFYVAFVIRHQPKYFRSYLLFLDERWKKVNKFTFDQYEVQYQLMDAYYPEEKEILKNKFHFFKHCQNHSIPTPDVIAVFDTGCLLFPESSNLDIPETDLFIKDLYGKSGQGVQRFCFHNKYYRSGINTYSKEDLLHYFIEYSTEVRATVVQTVKKNHNFWMPFTSGALCTCRIVTARIPDGQDIQPLFCNFRMPVQNMEADNFALGGIASNVDIKNGYLQNAISTKPVEGRYLFDVHPDTGQSITGTRLPKFEEMIEFAISVHKTFKTKFIGWDVSLTSQGFCIIEGNIGWGADIVESTSNTPLTETRYPNLFEAWMDRKTS